MPPLQPSFRAHFEISQPTPRYAGLLSLLPPELVATPPLLAAVVRLLCAEMRQAFERHGLPVPPWREAQSLLSK